MAKETESEVHCHECGVEIGVHYRGKTTVLTACAILVNLLLFELWAFVLMPFFILLFQSSDLVCKKCNSVLQTFHPFHLKEEIFTVKFAKCVLVFTKSYLVLLFLVCLFGVATYKYKTPESHLTNQAIDNSWEDYIQACGASVLAYNEVKAYNNFETNFKGKTVLWQGLLYNTTEYESMLRKEKALYILVKMIPSETYQEGDLILSLDSKDWLKNAGQLASMQRGTKFWFNATLVSMGTQFKFHHLKAHNINPNSLQ